MAKATKKNVLGRSLSNILNETSHNSNLLSNTNISTKLEISVSKIDLNPYQPRSSFKKERLNELISSIRNIGLIQPVTVKIISKGKYQLISGERRLRAFKKLKIKKIPCFIRNVNDQQSLEMALIENIQRDDLDSIEIALSYKRLIDEINLTQDELSKKIGKKRSTISNYLRLLKLNPIIQSGIKDGFISMGHGRSMINIDDESLQLKIYEKVIKNNLSVRNTEALIQSLKNKKPNKKNIILEKRILNLMSSIEKNLKSKVSVNFNKNHSGKITVKFNSKDDFYRICKKING